MADAMTDERLAEIKSDVEMWREPHVEMAAPELLAEIDRPRDDTDMRATLYEALELDGDMPTLTELIQLASEKIEQAQGPVAVTRCRKKPDTERIKQLEAENAELRHVVKRIVRLPCPKDTNGDGGCGRPLCPYCGIDIKNLANGGDGDEG